MTITKTERYHADHNDQTFNVICDDGRSPSCDGDENEFEGSFHSVVKEIQEKGWRSVKKPSGWEHRCPACTKLLREATSKSFRGKLENG